MLYLPMLNCVEFIREGYFGSEMTAHYDMGYLVAFNLCLTLLAVAMVKRLNVSSDFE